MGSARGWFAPSGRRRGLLHHDPAAERDRHAAHGARVPAHAHGRPRRAITACAATQRCGSRAPTTPASPRRWWSSASSNARGRAAAPTWAAKHSSSASGSGRNSPAAPSRGRCAGSATPSTGRASASPWTRACRARCTEVFVRLHDEGLIYRGKRLVNWDPVLHTARVRPRSAVRRKKNGRSGTCAIRSRTATVTSSSRRRAPRRCSATPRWPCIPTTSATST